MYFDISVAYDSFDFGRITTAYSRNLSNVHWTLHPLCFAFAALFCYNVAWLWSSLQSTASVLWSVRYSLQKHLKMLVMMLVSFFANGLLPHLKTSHLNITQFCLAWVCNDVGYYIYARRRVLFFYVYKTSFVERSYWTLLFKVVLSIKCCVIIGRWRWCSKCGSMVLAALRGCGKICGGNPLQQSMRHIYIQ